MFDITNVKVKLLTVSGKIVVRIVKVKCGNTDVAQNIVKRKYAKKFVKVLDISLA